MHGQCKVFTMSINKKSYITFRENSICIESVKGFYNVNQLEIRNCQV